MYPILRIVNRESGTVVDHGRAEERGARFFRLPTHTDLFPQRKPDDCMTYGSHVTSHVDRLVISGDSHFQIPTGSGPSNRNDGHYTRVLRTDNIEQYTRAKITMRSGFRTPDVQQNFSKKGPTQAVQNFRSGRDGQHADARVRLARALQMVRSGWTFCSMESSAMIRFAR
jgi:hypothetical protein